MQTLIDAGADLGAVDEQGSNAVMMAAIGRGPDLGVIAVLQLLLDGGVDVNAVNWLGDTALHRATLRGSTALVQFLVDHGADVHARDGSGRIPSTSRWAYRRSRSVQRCCDVVAERLRHGELSGGATGRLIRPPASTRRNRFSLRRLAEPEPLHQLLLHVRPVRDPPRAPAVKAVRDSAVHIELALPAAMYTARAQHGLRQELHALVVR